MTVVYDELEQFAGCFFGQDFDLDYATPDDAICAFPIDQGPDAVRGLLPEIDHLLGSPLDEDQLDDLWINRLHANYDPRDDGMTYREWFAHVRDLLTQTRPD